MFCFPLGITIICKLILRGAAPENGATPHTHLECLELEFDAPMSPSVGIRSEVLAHHPLELGLRLLPAGLSRLAECVTARASP